MVLKLYFCPHAVLNIRLGGERWGRGIATCPHIRTVHARTSSPSPLPRPLDVEAFESLLFTQYIDCKQTLQISFFSNQKDLYEYISNIKETLKGTSSSMVKVRVSIINENHLM